MKDHLSLRSGFTMQATQSLSDYGLKKGDDGKLVRLDGSRIKRNAAFHDWLYRLKRGERLPRGRWFRYKTPGRPLTIFDELSSIRPTLT